MLSSNKSLLRQVARRIADDTGQDVMILKGYGRRAGHWYTHLGPLTTEQDCRLEAIEYKGGGSFSID